MIVARRREAGTEIQVVADALPRSGLEPVAGGLWDVHFSVLHAAGLRRETSALRSYDGAADMQRQGSTMPAD